MNESLMKMYSIGIAAANLDPCKVVLEVIPIEHLTHLDGEVTAHQNVIEVSGVDKDGNAYASKLTTANSIQAIYKSTDSNAIGGPPVRRGEKVEIYRYGDTDKFYWKEMGFDGGNRRLDRVYKLYSNTRDESVKELNENNAYAIDIDTFNKVLRIATNSNDGEPVSYSIKIDTKQGIVNVSDSAGNKWEMRSTENYIQFKNGDDCAVELDRTNCKVTVPEKFSVNAQDAEFNIGNSFKVNAQTIDMDATESFSGTGGESAGLKAPEIGLAGTLGITSVSGGKGSGTVNADITYEGANHFTPEITAGGINIGPSHNHTEQGDGKPTSGVNP